MLGGEGTSRPVSRILWLQEPMIIHLRPLLPTAFPRRFHAGRATYPQASGGPPSNACAGEESSSFLVLLRVGFALPTQSPAPRWSLTPPFHPYPIARAVCFLWHCPAGHPGWMLSTTLPCGVRTFLDAEAPRSSGRLVQPTTLPSPVVPTYQLTCQSTCQPTCQPTDVPADGPARPGRDQTPDWEVRTRMRPHSSQRSTTSAPSAAMRCSSAESISRPQPPQRLARSSAAPVLPVCSATWL
ncbi:hypothetical protein MAJHIDBO_02157 [Propionibacterium freudenreichii subsp. shermanii]|uniref:Uncharacterized protein n=1 Tax=Propionibacterium freudenreichii TaxID=1744 RepID=A0A2C7APT6_9ACTN|nr:Hypothetical protein PFR_JS22-1_726 [Propionibacterium freudenreichii]SCQ68282.1 Hypothetical protein PFR_JS17-1_771 [Propionibacterium freudenreichii]SCQ77885.1 Hypothetical protein PFR_JS17-2_770 [Propionibacterium freudenreichii]SPB32117.1 hypothetical protein MAJHIDBO_02157 [Propionibacterium freudenreichii subsp. shermanii]SPS09938.1 hypothetical protein MAJHIDBO_02157 [Propionibacterium freudenreichii subsp. shermanii]